MSVTESRAPRRDFAENRAALLTAARIVLNQDPDASMETIATEAGLSRRAVYGHFANRDELLRELVITGSARIAGALDTVSHTDPLVRLALIVSRVWRELADVRVMALLTVRGPLAVHTTPALAPLRAAVLGGVRLSGIASTVGGKSALYTGRVGFPMLACVACSLLR